MKLRTLHSTSFGILPPVIQCSENSLRIFAECTIARMNNHVKSDGTRALQQRILIRDSGFEGNRRHDKAIFKSIRRQKKRLIVSHPMYPSFPFMFMFPDKDHQVIFAIPSAHIFPFYSNHTYKLPSRPEPATF
jgi:hypothetical protein